MSRFENKFAQLRAAGRKALITFFTACVHEHGNKAYKNWNLRKGLLISA